MEEMTLDKDFTNPYEGIVVVKNSGGGNPNHDPHTGEFSTGTSVSVESTIKKIQPLMDRAKKSFEDSKARNRDPWKTGDVEITKKVNNGGAGSGDHGHGGRPGLIGGSSGGHGSIGTESIDTSYRGSHGAPNREDETSAPGHDMQGEIGTFPSDIYTAPNADRLYSSGYPQMDREAIGIIRTMHNKPNHEVKVYRAVPDKSNIKDINPGDWIGITKGYAVLHGESNLGDEYKLLEKTVRAQDIWNDGNSIQEWGYDPSTTKNEVDGMVRNAGGGNPNHDPQTGRFATGVGSGSLNAELTSRAKNYKSEDDFVKGETNYYRGEFTNRTLHETDGDVGEGFYFTDNRATAYRYSGKEEIVNKFHIGKVNTFDYSQSPENGKDIIAKFHKQNLKALKANPAGQYLTTMKGVIANHSDGTSYNALMDIAQRSGKTRGDVRDFLKKEGFDGIKYNQSDTVWDLDPHLEAGNLVLFNTKQVADETAMRQAYRNGTAKNSVFNAGGGNPNHDPKSGRFTTGEASIKGNNMVMTYQGKSSSVKLNKYEKELFQSNQITVDITDSKETPYIKGKYGYYDPPSKKIYMNGEHIGTEHIESTFYHEFGHAADHVGKGKITGVETYPRNMFKSRAKSNPHTAEKEYIVAERLNEALRTNYGMTNRDIAKIIPANRDKLMKGQFIVVNKEDGGFETPMFLKRQIKYTQQTDEVFADAYSQYRRFPEEFKKNAPVTSTNIEELMQ